MTQQTLRRHDDERLSQRPQHLPAQHVEHLRGRRGYAHLDVVFGAELQEALEPGRGMLRPLAFVAVRQEQREPRQPPPFGFARTDELIDDHLGAVAKSPNWPSQMVRQWGSVVENPYSNPITASSDSTESVIVKVG